MSSTTIGRRVTRQVAKSLVCLAMAGSAVHAQKSPSVHAAGAGGPPSAPFLQVRLTNFVSGTLLDLEATQAITPEAVRVGPLKFSLRGTILDLQGNRLGKNVSIEWIARRNSLPRASSTIANVHTFEMDRGPRTVVIDLPGPDGVRTAFVLSEDAGTNAFIRLGPQWTPLVENGQAAPLLAFLIGALGADSNLRGLVACDTTVQECVSSAVGACGRGNVSSLSYKCNQETGEHSCDFECNQPS